MLTRRYWAIQGAPSGGSIGVVETEIDDREAALAETIRWVEDLGRTWAAAPGRLVVADTSVYCQHENKLEDIDFASALDLGPHPVRLMIPILVLDELEGLKQSSKQRTRWRAAHTLGKLDEVSHHNGGACSMTKPTPRRAAASVQRRLTSTSRCTSTPRDTAGSPSTMTSSSTAHSPFRLSQGRTSHS